MTEHDRDEFRAIIEQLWTLYNQKQKPETMQIAGYWEALKVYSLVDVRTALNTHYTNPDNGQFLPKPADLVRLLQGDSQSQAGQASTKVDKALRIHGPYRDVCFDDPIIHKVIADMGGWVHFCTRSNDDDYVFQIKEFENRYQAYVNRPPAEYPRLLTGISAHGNGVRGYQRKELPALVGNPERAEQVYRHGGDQQSLADQRNRNRIAALIATAERNHQVAQLEDQSQSGTD